MIGSEKKLPVASGQLPVDDFSLCWFFTGHWQLATGN
jgi:hypothetical protein